MYSGRAACAATLGEDLWVFFRGPHARRYPLRGGGPGGGCPERLPFDWTPEAACRGGRDELWVVGRDGAGAARVARLHGGEPAEWETGFPALPGPGRVLSPGGTQPGRGVPSGRVRLRALVAGDLYVFWSVGSSESPAALVRGARLAPGGRGEPAEAWRWEGLPTLASAHSDFCAAPGAGPRLVLREPPLGLTGRPVRRLLEVELDAGGRSWSAPRVLLESDAAFLFDYAPGSSCAAWVTGAVLARTDRQRVELLVEDGSSGWRALEPASALRLHLGEFQVILVMAGAVGLVAAGGAGFAMGLARMRSAARPAPVPRAAPIAARALAAAIDLALAGGAAVWAVGMPPPASDPLVPGLGPLLVHAAALGALAAYGALFEGLFGATPGKFVMGIRVVRMGGGPAGPGRVLIRNLLRPVDLFPPYTGAVGLGLMALTASRRRLGDMVAGTVVVSVEEGQAGEP